MFLDFRVAPTPMRSSVPPSVRLTRFYRHIFLWVLQGWLAMFYIGAAAAKLSHSHDTLSFMLVWPARVNPELVQAIGYGELILAIAVLTPLASWRAFRPVLLIGAGGLLADALVMGVWHGLEGQGYLALTQFEFRR